jgi:hypothetical protein
MVKYPEQELSDPRLPQMEDEAKTSASSFLALPPEFSKYIVVDEATGCWLWTGASTSRDYGIWRGQSAARCAWEFLHGPLSEGMLLAHRCGRAACVNPEHSTPLLAASAMRLIVPRGTTWRFVEVAK